MKRILGLLLIVVIALMGCKTKGPSAKESKELSWGKPQTVYIFADDSVWKPLEAQLNQTFAQTFTTTEEEPWFEIKHVPFSDFQIYYKYDNLIFISAHDAHGEATTRTEQLLGDNTPVAPDSAAVFTRDGLWAADQYVLFVAAGSQKTLNLYIPQAADQIFNMMAAKLKARVAAKVYIPGIRSPKELDKLPWTANIPNSYVPFRTNAASGFYSYLQRANKIDRYFAVYRADWDGKTDLTQWGISTRNRIVKNFYEGDSISVKDVKHAETTLNGMPATKIWGRWQNRNYYVGGAFQAFMVRDPSSHTVYFVDNSVYYPDGSKLEPLLELEAVSATFRLRSTQTR